MIRVLLLVFALLLPCALFGSTPPESKQSEPAWTRVHLNNPSERELLPVGAIDYGTFAWLPVTEVPVALAANRLDIQPQPFHLRLGDRSFDPAFDFPAGDDPWFVPGETTQPDYRLVQFRGPIKPEWLTALRAEGVEPVQYVHPFGYIVWSGGAALSRAGARPELRFAGPFLPAFRVPEQSRLSQAAHGAAMALVHRDSTPSVHAALANVGVTVVSSDPIGSRFSVLHLVATPDRFLDIARIAGVYTVQEITQDAGPRGEMSNQSIVGGYDSGNIIAPGYLDWLTPTGLDGSGVVVGIVDGGIRTTHQDLVSRMVPCVSAGGSPTSCTTSNNSHGTHVAGAVAGTGDSGVTDAAGFLRGQGVAPGASLVQQRYPAFLGGGPGGMIPSGMLTIFEESVLSGALLTNNSWGPSGTPQGYNIPTMEIDIISRDADPDTEGQQPVLAVWSIMNGGGDGGGACAPSSLGAPDEAKNLLGVGSTKLQNSNGTQIVDIFDVSSNSAHGPACDGRLVPHIVAPGCRTDSTSSGSNTAFGLACGTSMASPVVSGAVALYAEQYQAVHGVYPSPALVKAMFTATATDLEGNRNANNGTMGHRPDRFQGWGRLDLDRTINPPASVFLLDQSEVFDETGQTWTREFIPDDPAQPIQVMLAWSDAPGSGTGGTTPAWVNDLDLTVDASSGSYRGNVFNPATGFSATGGSADHRNNLEGVVLAAAQHEDAPFTVTILAANVAADALDPWTPEPDATRQDFAIVCLNCVDATGIDEADLSVTKSVDPEVAVHGANVVFTITAANAGPVDATGVVVVDQLPSGYAFVGANASIGSYDDGTGVWTIGDLDASADATLEITATVQASGEYENVASIAGEQVDPDAENDSDSATVIAIAPDSTDLSISKQVDLTGVAVGATVVFTLTAANDGPGNATDVAVQDLLPLGYSFVSAVASTGTYDENTGEWLIGGMHDGESATLEITATVNLIDAWMNTATISGAEVDPFPDNNSDSASAEPNVSLDVFADGFE